MSDTTAFRLAGIATAVLRLAPREFRDAYRAEVTATFAMALAAERRARGRVAMVSLWVRGLLDAIRTVRAERRAGRQPGGRRPFGDLGSDARQAMRSWRRAPMLPATVVLILTLGLGLSSAIFAFADGYLFRPLPFPDADRLYFVRVPDAAIASTTTAREAELLRETAVGRFGFVEWGGGRPDVPDYGDLLLSDTSLPYRLEGVSPGFADTIRVPLALGRVFRSEDHRPSAPPVAWLSYRLWDRAFGADPQILGQRVALRGPRGPVELEVVGVMAREVTAFDLNNPPPDLVVPAVARDTSRQGSLSFPIVRLPSSVSVAAAEAEIGAALQAVAPAPGGASRSVRLSSVYDYQTRGGRPTAVVFFAGAMLVLLLVAVSLVHLLLTRGLARQAEVAVRGALGASRWRIARLFLAESLLLGGVGLGGGLVLGAWLSAIIAAAIPTYPSVSGRNLALITMSFDTRAMAFAAALGLLVAVLGGLFPAWHALRQELGTVTRSASGVVGRLSARTSRAALASEVAVAAVILVGAAFMTLGISRYLNQPLGFELEHRYSIGFEVPSREAGEGIDWQAALEAVRRVSGIEKAAVGQPAAAGMVETSLPPGASRVLAVAVGTDYFETWGVPVVAGRAPSAAEIAADAPVAVVDSNLAALVWPEQSALGQTVVTTGQQPRVVVGVIEPMKRRLGAAPSPTAYLPMPAVPSRPTLVVWAPQLTAAEVEQRVTGPLRAVVPIAQPFVRAEAFDDRFARDIGEARFQQPIVLVFGGFAFAVAAVGLFGLVSYLVTMRTRDYAIQIALGAGAWNLCRGVVRESVAPAALGLTVGIAVAAMLERSVRSTVFGWESSGPLAMLIVALSLLAVAVLAAAGPARRVLKIDPTEALRMDG